MYEILDRLVQHVYEYRHIPERDLEHASAWELVGSNLVQHLTAKPV